MGGHESVLRSAGLEVLGTSASAGGLLPEQAWKRIISLGAAPTVEIDDQDDDYLDRADAEWRRLADEHGLLAADGTFLISPSGLGAMSLPWVVVRLTTTARLAEHLCVNPGEPEFVTAARDGHLILGVTSEERGVWLVLG